MINTIIWLGTLGVLYLLFIVTTPVKAPPPIRESFKVEITQADLDKANEKPVEAAAAAPAAPTVEFNPVDIEKGKAIYTTTCIKCHNKDPNIKGAIGPEMVDAPLEVMVAKVSTGRYPEKLPEGFVPKRTTKQMTKFPAHVPDVPSIHAYVQSLKKK